MSSSEWTPEEHAAVLFRLSHAMFPSQPVRGAEATQDRDWPGGGPQGDEAASPGALTDIKEGSDAD